MERKIGEIFEYNGEWYQCIGHPYNECTDCDFCFETGKACVRQIVGQCSMSNRSDGLSVAFKKLEKVGEPFTSAGKLYQHYKVFDIDNVCGDVFWCVHNYKAKTLTIEIKQNKEEDMKTVRISKDDLNFLVNKIRYGILPKHTDYGEIIAEITDLFSVEDVNLSNSENIGKNLKPFDLQAAKSGKPVYTRGGRKARIICFNSKNDPQRPIVVLVEHNDNELLYEYTIEGKERFSHISTTGTSDLMWVNVYKDGLLDTKSYPTKKEAFDKACSEGYVDTVKVCWEE